jgi:hypothetical protein
MTVEQAEEFCQNEMKKLEALKKVAAILEKLEEDVDYEAVEWLLEKVAE